MLAVKRERSSDAGQGAQLVSAMKKVKRERSSDAGAQLVPAVKKVKRERSSDAGQGAQLVPASVGSVICAEDLEKKQARLEARKAKQKEYEKNRSNRQRTRKTCGGDHELLNARVAEVLAENEELLAENHKLTAEKEALSSELKVVLKQLEDVIRYVPRTPSPLIRRRRSPSP